MTLSGELALKGAMGLSQGSLPNDDVDTKCIMSPTNFTRSTPLVLLGQLILEEMKLIIQLLSIPCYFLSLRHTATSRSPLNYPLYARIEDYSDTLEHQLAG
jgi:hypothetical protein